MKERDHGSTHKELNRNDFHECLKLIKASRFSLPQGDFVFPGISTSVYALVTPEMLWKAQAHNLLRTKMPNRPMNKRVRLKMPAERLSDLLSLIPFL